MLDANHATANVARAPAAAASAGNSRPIATYTSANNDAMVRSVTGINQTTKWGFAGWFRQPVSALETVFCIFTGTNGASARKVLCQFTTSRRVIFGAYISGTDGRMGTTAINALPAAGTWAWVYWLYDSSLGGDANIRIRINTVNQAGLTMANIGVGGTLTTLPAPTGNGIFGNLSDAVSLQGFNGDIGPNAFFLNDDLTVDEETNLMNFEAPT